MSAWLEVLGRAHPMVLHLPIGFLIALCVFEFVGGDGAAPRPAQRWLVRLTALSSVAAIATGLLHANGGDFAGDRLELHRNLGIALGIIVLLAWFLHERLAAAKAPAGRRGYRLALAAGMCLMVPAGHFGAELTHGPGFLTEPLSEPVVPVAPVVAAVAVEPPSSYALVIRPILDAKCVTCHGETKRKGGLSLSTSEGLLAGGRRGPALLRESPGTSPMLARIELDSEDDKHMPPLDHEQLLPDELRALRAWFAAGAPFEGSVPGMSEGQGLSASVAPVETKAQAAPIPPAPAEAIAALRGALAHVQPLGADSNLLWIDFSALAKTLDDKTACALLAPVSEQLAELSLARSAIGAPTLAALSNCSRLQRLDLRATAIDTASLAPLAKLPNLTELVLSQNRLSDECIDTLLALPVVERVHLWRSGITQEGIARLRQARPELAIEDGGAHEAAALEVEPNVVFTRAGADSAVASAPVPAPAPSLAPINTKCPVTGAPVKPEFLVVHEGRVIGFCCSECPSRFLADPAKFAAQIP